MTSSSPTILAARDRHDSGFHLGRTSGVVGEVLVCFARGDYLGVLALADAVVADDRPLVRLVPDGQTECLSLDHREGFVLSLIDGRAPVEAVLDASAMPLLDALRIVCELIDRRVIGPAKV